MEDECGECGGDGIAEGACDCDGNVPDVCGTCGGDGILGCGISLACNFDPLASCFDNDLCEFESCAGCLDEDACNYDGDAIFPGLCEYPEITYQDCDGNCLPEFDSNENGICDPEEVPGCMDESAVNFNPEANVDNGTCLIINVGCGNSEACNYDPLVTVNAAGLCDFPETIFKIVTGIVTTTPTVMVFATKWRLQGAPCLVRVTARGRRMTMAHVLLGDAPFLLQFLPVTTIQMRTF